MTHLSDYSFLQRATGLSYIYLWYIYRMYKTEGYKCLSFDNILSCRVKYQEGYVQVGPGHIITKPEILWTKADKEIIVPTNYSICIGFSLQTGTLLLLQCFWNYLMKLVTGEPFMSSKEFKVYIIWTLLVISLLGVVSHFRFRRFLILLKAKRDTAVMTNRIHYYKDLNLLLSVSLFIFSVFLITLCADGLSTTKKLNKSKFYSDFFICNVNVVMMSIWTIVILIFHPKNELKETLQHSW
ncbi:hypothetical protein BY458DRAFT_531909 [Sporodiniella umbellata]|nr:hypothetical protein BY458DRAFT_531909 [Sporodiniella umbellata]